MKGVMRKIKTPHDRFVRSMFSNPRVVKEFFDIHLPDRIRRLVDLSSLALQKESYIDEALNLHVTDLLF